jgi:hypothetical protein
MPRSKFRRSYSFDKPRDYRIRVRGIINETWSEKLGGLRITAGRFRNQEKPVTELVGQVRDQAELSGVLNALYELHMTLLSVEYLNSD